MNKRIPDVVEAVTLNYSAPEKDPSKKLNNNQNPNTYRETT